MRAIIFDLDGTLLQSMAVDCEILERSIAEILGSVRFRDNYNCYDNVTDRGIVEELMVDNGFAPNISTVNAVRDAFVHALSNHIERSGPFIAVRGASQFLGQLCTDANTRVAIATGCWRKSAMLKLESSGLEISGIPIATCDDTASRTEIMQIALGQLGAPFSSVTYFGDALWDVEACEALDWRFVAVGSDLAGIESYEGLLI
ncbi:MAG TPA: HAD family hydrolase [Woeseiaceae bacterium]|nr:HAD family hydrolase [Woeseiaceae bacterium]